MLQKLLNIIIKPYYAITVPVLLSLFAWLIPDGWIDVAVRGFDKKENFGFNAFVLLLSWYFIAFISSYLFFHLGRINHQVSTFNKRVPLNGFRIYSIYSFIAWIGFFMTIFKVLKVVGFGGLVVTLFVDFQANAIKDILYDDYSIGLLSLRYIVVLTFGMALYRIQVLKEYKIINFTNVVVFILYTAVLGRRLDLIEGMVVYLALANRDGQLLKKIKIRNLYLSFFIGASLLVLATTVRNYNTFKSAGSTNVLSATLSNVIQYLGPPMQVTFSIANNIDLATNGHSYWKFTNVSESLTTNSALSTIIYTWGWWAYAYSFLLCGFWSYIAGWASKNKNNYLYIIYPIIIYGFLEYWRINIFSTGIFYTLIIVGLGVPIFVVMFLPYKLKRST